MSTPFTPTTPIVAPKSGVDQNDLMDFAASLAITLPKNDTLNKMTVYIASTGEPAEGYVGKPLVKHCKEWTTIKETDNIIDKLQGLMYLRIIFCAATQSNEKNWAEFQNSDEYLYGFDESKINPSQSSSRGVDYVDQNVWNKVTKNQDVETALNKNTKINQGSYDTSVQITFTTMAKKVMGQNAIPESKEAKTESVSSTRMMKIKDKTNEVTLTQSQMEYRNADMWSKMQEQQSKINQSMKNKGKREWKWKTNEKEKKRKAYEKYMKEKAEKEKKERAMRSKMGGDDGVQTTYAHFIEEDEKDDNGNRNDKTKVKKNDQPYPIGSDDIQYYDKGMIVHVWSQGKKQWIDGEVLEVIKFVKTVKIKHDGKTQQFRIPNVKMVRLKE